MRKTATMLLISVLVALSAQPARAQGALILTDAQIFGIQENCLKSKAALERLHAADTLLRVNLGQRFENISLRLMAPFNSRVALNGLDGVALTKLTVEYNQALKEFSATYSKYDTAVGAAIRSDCVKDPVGYYQKIAQARADRARVHERSEAATKLLGDYLAASDALDKEVAHD